MKPNPIRKEASQGGRILFIVYLAHSSGPARLAFVPAQAPVLIGRLDPTNPESVSGLSLDHDLMVSARHVQLLRLGAKWVMEDLGSTYGTMVDGQEIKGKGPVEYDPGTPVRTGETIWTAIPQQWLLVPHRETIVAGPCAAALSYVLYHCGTPIVGPLFAWNMGDRTSPAVELRLELNQYSDPCPVFIPSLEPGSRVSLGLPHLRLYPERLRMHGSPQKSTLTLNVDGNNRPELSKEFLILGLWDWPFDPAARTTLAALVTPHDPTVDLATAGACAELARLVPGETIKSLLRSGNDNAEMLCIEALYRFLSGTNIQYTPPRLRRFFNSTCFYQEIRPAEQVFPRGGGPGAGTCLDIALFFASCMEKMDLAPLIFLSGENAEEITHAFAGCWVGPAPGSRAIIDDVALLRQEVASKQIIVLESTGVAKGFSKNAPPMLFQEAVVEAEKLLVDMQWACALDVTALRPPRGRIASIEYPFAPAVAAAVSSAWDLARTKKREHVELLHLFYGVLAAEGEVAEKIMRQAGYQLPLLKSHLKARISSRGFTGEPSPTTNYTACLRLAGDLAWQSGPGYIREQDLLWAVLIQAPNSNVFIKLLRELHVDPARIKLALQQMNFRPDLKASYFKP